MKKLIYLIVFVIFLTSCKKNNTLQGESPTAIIEISPSSTKIRVGDTLKLTALAKDVSGNIISGKPISWVSSSLSVAIVDNGVVIGKGIGSTTISASADGKSKNIQITVSGAINIPFVEVPFQFGTDVPQIIQTKVDKFYSALGYSIKGADLTIPLIKDKKENIVFALDNQENIILIGLANGSEVKLDAFTSAISIVRFALNSSATGSLTEEQMNSSITSASSFPQLKDIIQQSLNNGQLLFENESIFLKTLDVMKEVLIAKGGLIPGKIHARTNGQKYDFINTIWKGENLWFEDFSGPSVIFSNDTRLDWVVTSKDLLSGNQIDSKRLPWLPFKLEEFITFLNPPTETLLFVSNTLTDNKFSLTVEQTRETRSKHCLYFMQMLGFNLLNWTTTSTGQKKIDCSIQFANAIFNDKMPDLLNEQTGKAALDYINSVLDKIESPWLLSTLNKCGIELPGAEVLPGQFLKSLVSFWKKIQTSIAFGTLAEFSYQIRTYWDYNETKTFCKVNGLIANCPILPVVQTVLATSITQTTAISGGNITNDGGASITARGVCWSTSMNPTIANSKTSDGTGTGNFTSSLTGLTANTTYYVRAYATNSAGTAYGNEISILTTQSSSSEVAIGNQIWTTKNLDVTTYRNGDPIPQVTDPAQWSALTTGAWCYYNNAPANGAVYGKLYNWYAVNDSRGLAPAGWHIPTDAEWTTLEIFLGGASVAGGKIKETGTTHWLSPNTGASNSSGFTGLPGGYRTLVIFDYFGISGIWWSSTTIDVDNAKYRLVDYLGAGMAGMATGIGFNKAGGFSVRCIKD